MIFPQFLCHHTDEMTQKDNTAEIRTPLLKYNDTRRIESEALRRKRQLNDWNREKCGTNLFLFLFLRLCAIAWYGWRRMNHWLLWPLNIKWIKTTICMCLPEWVFFCVCICGCLWLFMCVWHYLTQQCKFFSLTKSSKRILKKVHDFPDGSQFSGSRNFGPGPSWWFFPGDIILSSLSLELS